jgi:ATP-binding cassette subfamily B protein
VVPPYLVKEVIDTGIATKNIGLIWSLAGAIMGTFVLVAVVDKIRSFWGHILAQRIAYNLRNDLYSHLQRLSFRFYDNTSTGELLSRMVDDLSVVEEVLYHGPQSIIGNGCMLLFAGVLIFTLNWRLALASLAVLPAIFLIDYRIFLTMFKGARKVRKAMALFAGRMEENFSGMRIIQSFVREKHEMRKFEEENRQHYQSRIGVIRSMSWIFPASISILGVSLAIGLGYGSLQVVAGVMTVGALAAFVMYLQRFMSPLVELSRIGESVVRFLAGIERYFEYMDTYPDVKDSSKAVGIVDTKGEIQFQDVWFRYDKDTVLKGINFLVHPGETLALVGPSGSGKTTITRLIPRFYQPFRGRVLLDGKNIADLKLHPLRNQIGIVMQNDFLFSESLANNIAYGRLDASEEEIMEAARKANIHDFVQELPQAYDTEIGERGVKLSEGQAQRISIARAILRDPPILILDEATSSIDSETEILIQEALEKLKEEKTCIVIAHRLSTILRADRILFIENGQVIEEGNHQQLLERGGRYAHFYNLQFNNLA